MRIASVRFSRGVCLQPDHRFDARGDLLDAVRLRPVGEGAKAERRVQRRSRLEGHRAGEDAAVEFRHHDMHGEVGGRQTALALLPRPRGAWSRR